MKDEIIDVKIKIIPSKIIYRRQIKKITRIERDYIINGYKIFLKNGKISKVTIKSKHPNCNPNNNEFCIPSNVKNLKLDKNAFVEIENLFRIFNLDNCYFTPWKSFRYEE